MANQGKKEVNGSKLNLNETNKKPINLKRLLYAIIGIICVLFVAIQYIIITLVYIIFCPAKAILDIIIGGKYE
jgi:hypothetical protein